MFIRVVATRAAGSVAAVAGASIAAFLLMRVLPGDPVRLILGPFATEAALEAQREALGLDQSLPDQYFTFITDFVRGDWGFSFTTGQPVATQIGARLPATLELALFAFLLCFIGALILGLAAAYHRGRIVDRMVRYLSFFGLGTPPFWLGLMLLVIFFESAEILPGPEGRLSFQKDAPPGITGFYTIDALLSGEGGTFVDAAKHLVLPTVALALAPFAYLVRLLRTNLLDVSREPFMVAVRSKGVSRWTAFYRHALPNAFLPTLTAAGLVFGQLVAGSVLVEKVFNWPGVGQLVVDAILRQDFAVVQAFILLSAVAYVVVSAVVDILYGVIDPRVRVGRSQ